MATATLPARLRLVAALLLVAPYVTGAALAQVPVAPQVTVALDEATLSLGAGNETVVAGTVTNGGSLQGTVALALTLPDGWNATVDPPTAFTLPAGASAPITLTLTAPAAGVGAATGDVFLDATITDGAGQSGTAQASIALTRVDPLVIIPPPPYGLYAAYAIGGTAIVALGSITLLQRRRNRLARERAAAEETRKKAEHEAYLARETGIGISLVEGPLRYGSRREQVFRLAIENQTDRDRIAHIGVLDPPAGWTAAAAIPKLPLKPRERVIVTFYANPGDTIPGGTLAHVSFYAKPEEARELDQRVTIDVTAPDVRIPNPDTITPLPRDGAPPRPALRR